MTIGKDVLPGFKQNTKLKARTKTIKVGMDVSKPTKSIRTQKVGKISPLSKKHTFSSKVRSNIKAITDKFEKASKKEKKAINNEKLGM